MASVPVAFRWGLWLLLAMRLPASGQSLARKNWEGSGLRPETWWARAVFCVVPMSAEAEGAAGWKGLVARLDGLQAMGCDALEVRLPGGGVPRVAEDADDLIAGVARRRMRLVVGLPRGAEGAVEAGVRFWLNRGVAGFAVAEDVAGDAEGMRAVRRMVAAAPGGRILVGEGDGGFQLRVRRVGVSGVGIRSAGQLRERLSEAGGSSGGAGLAAGSVGARGARADTLLGWGGGGGGVTKRVRAAILLGSGWAAALDLEEEKGAGSGRTGAQAGVRLAADDLALWLPLGEDGGAAAAPTEDAGGWDRDLIALHHGHAALRSGRAVYLDFDAQEALVWVARPLGAGWPLLFICNLSGSAMHLDVGGALRGLGVRGSYVKALLGGGDAGLAGLARGIDVGVDGVFAGEIR